MTEGMFFTLGRNRISGRENIWPNTEAETECTNVRKNRGNFAIAPLASNLWPKIQFCHISVKISRSIGMRA